MSFPGLPDRTGPTLLLEPAVGLSGVVPSPFFDQGLGLAQIMEDLPSKQLTADLSFDALAVGVRITIDPRETLSYLSRRRFQGLKPAALRKAVIHMRQ